MQINHLIYNFIEKLVQSDIFHFDLNMSGKNIKLVNIMMPKPIKIKTEILDDDVETVSCRLCHKTFVSEVAITNHVRLEHIDAYASGDKDSWMEHIVVKTKDDIKIEKVLMDQDSEIVSSAPLTMTKVAMDDVSYIIVQSDDNGSISKKRKIEKLKAERQQRIIVQKKEKEVKPITGPFECLQPSHLVADSTCHQIFFTCCEYSIHFRDEHTRKRKGIRCQVCEKPLFPWLENSQHPYNCQVCLAGFNTNKELTEHINTAHVKLKPFQCKVCNKRFTQQGGVQQHMRMHTGDRPFSCTFCTKSFTQKSGLDQHLRIHTKLKPYRCVVCDKTFCQSTHLKQHMRIHTNVTPFQCGICQKKFKQSSHLNYHLRAHNSINMSDDQKEKYKELLGLMESELVEVEVDQSEVDLSEQYEAEQSVQVEEIDYVPDTWAVEVVES